MFNHIVNDIEGYDVFVRPMMCHIISAFDFVNIIRRSAIQSKLRINVLILNRLYILQTLRSDNGSVFLFFRLVG